MSRSARQRRTRRALRPTTPRTALCPRGSSRLRFERLEERRLLAITVNTLVDEFDGSIVDGDISLRDAIATAASGETIDFDPALTAGGPAMLTLALGELVLPKSLTITGPGADRLTIDAHGVSRVLRIDDGTSSLIDAAISGLTLTGGSAKGFNSGGAVLSSEKLVLRGVAIAGNSSSFMGGGIFSTVGSLTVVDSTISGNTASHGGGIFSGAGGSPHSLSIVNSTLSGNSASIAGGGVFGFEGVNSIRHSTITANTAPAGRGSGVASYASSATQTKVHSSIIAGNTAGDIDLFGGAGVNSFYSDGYNVIGVGTGLVAFANNDQTGVLNPLLGPLAANGGPTRTHALLDGSPAANGGDPAAVAGMGGVPPFDQRGSGFGRVVYGRIDVGAFEAPFLVEANLVVDTLADELDGNIEPGDLSLREAIGLANLDPDLQTITFAPALTSGGPATIELALGEMAVLHAINLTGPGASLLTVDANSSGRIFRIDDGNAATQINVSIEGLRLTGGNVQSSGDGGAIFNQEHLTITRSVLSGNMALGGGSIYHRDGNLAIRESTLSGNTASLYGGAILNNGGNLTISDSTLSGNTAKGGGGLASNTDLTTRTTTILGSTLSGNTATNRGGGVLNLAGRTVIRHSTITANTAPATGGSGLASYGTAETRTEVAGTILAGNLSSDVDTVAGGMSSLASLGYNLLGSGNAASSFNQPGDQTGVMNVGLGPLASNGGPTRTHALLLGSPAINAGDPAAVAGMGGVPQFDQRGSGFGRVIGNRIDIGAVEIQQPDILVSTIIDEDDADFSLGDLSLREAIVLANGRSDAPSIQFASSLTSGGPATVELTLGEMAIVRSVSLLGPGANRLTIDANSSGRLFRIDDGNAATQINVSIEGLRVTGGNVLGSGDGGAILTAEKLALRSVEVAENSAMHGGGIAGAGELLVVDSTIAGNEAIAGGGIHFSGLLTVLSSTVSGNSASTDGGGILNLQGKVEIHHSTVTANSATANRGSGVATVGADAATRAYSSIIAGNVQSDVDAIAGADAADVKSLGFNLLGNGNAAASFTQPGDRAGVTMPLLGSLANNGGPTRTHVLLVGSPAVNAGDPAAVAGIGNIPEFDQRGPGFARVHNGRLDIGAFEALFVPGATIVVDSLADELDGNTGAGDFTLREALWLANLQPDAHTIEFAPGLTSGGSASIGLALGQLVVSESLSISGPGANVLAIDAGGSGRVLSVDDGAEAELIDVSLRGLALRGGSLNGFSVGSGILNRENLTITSSEVIGNTNSFFGGGIWTEGGRLTVRDSTIADNTASHGGGIFAGSSPSMPSLVIENSTISGNTATVAGGGLLNMAASAVIGHSTITANVAPNTAGSGIASYGSSMVKTDVRSSIISGNAASDVDLFGGDAVNSFQSSGYNVIGMGSGVTAFTNNDQVNIVDPRLNPLALNGGATRTHAPSSGSPAFDAGDPAAAAGMGGVPPFDQRGNGFPRVSNGRVDVGAFEQQFVVPALPGDYSHDGTVDAVDFIVWRAANGTTVPPFTSADGNGDGAIDSLDYDIWRANFGTVQATPAIANTAAGSAAIVDAPAIGIQHVGSNRIGEARSSTSVARDTDQRLARTFGYARRPAFDTRSDALLSTLLAIRTSEDRRTNKPAKLGDGTEPTDTHNPLGRSIAAVDQVFSQIAAE